MAGTKELLQQDCTLPDLLAHAADGKLYAVLDACDTALVPAKAIELGEERSICLYRGRALRDYWGFAPFLFHCDKSLVSWIHDNLWAEPWGMFAVADADFEAMRKHFRKFLMVENPSGKQVYFRFYDPRVLSKFLPSCNSQELDEFFGPIEKFALNPKGELFYLTR